MGREVHHRNTWAVPPFSSRSRLIQETAFCLICLSAGGPPAFRRCAEGSARGSGATRCCAAAGCRGLDWVDVKSSDCRARPVSHGHDTGHPRFIRLSPGANPMPFRSPSAMLLPRFAHDRTMSLLPTPSNATEHHRGQGRGGHPGRVPRHDADSQGAARHSHSPEGVPRPHGILAE